MPLYDFQCEKCDATFESIVTHSVATGESPRSKEVVCPQCQSDAVTCLVARFRVGGRGDLRESTFHGCHETHDAMSREQDSKSSHSCHAHCSHSDKKTA